MFDMEDFFGMGFEEEFVNLSNDLVEGGCEPGMEEGGEEFPFWEEPLVALWERGSGRNSPIGSCQPAVFESFSPEEKIFLRQIWRFEEEIDKAKEQDDVERMILLLNGFVGCMHGPWKDHFPGNEGYSPSEKFNSEFENLALPILNKAASYREDELNARLTPEQFDRIDGRNKDAESGQLDAHFRTESI